jgi:tetratricopeptide (TPR) repeat protein
MYRKITGIPAAESDSFENSVSVFLKRYPKSKFAPLIILLKAERQKDIDLAIQDYRMIIQKYPSFDGREFCLYRLCQILDLKSKWEELEYETSRALKIYPHGRYSVEFRLMRATSLLMLEDFDACKHECLLITESSHDLEFLARATHLMAEAEKKISGNSKAYITLLRQLVTGFSKSDISPSILFSLGNYYQQKKYNDQAYSAYTDLIKKYPESPESVFAFMAIQSLKKYKPVYVKYLPDNRTIDEADTIDIEPAYQADPVSGDRYYCVIIGPFSKKKDTDSIIRLISDYDESRVVKTGSGYTILLGRFADTDNALSARIRLAEEYGINGSIVLFSKDKSGSYIYGD